MHLTRTTSAAMALLLALFVSACGASAASSSAQTSTAESVASLEPSAEPSGEASSGLPTPGAVADLEALIPDEIGGIELQKFSMKGDEFVNSQSATEETEDFLRGLGVSTDDVGVAFGFGFSSETGDAVAMFVFRAVGAGTDRLVSVFKEATDSERQTPLDWEPATVGGKQVERATDSEQQGQTIYLYAKDDILFFLAASQEEQAAEALAGLP
jgi:hypothetical protein